MLDLICARAELTSAAATEWRRGPESNRRVKVLQTSPLPLGYRAQFTTLSVSEQRNLC
jgi:hypothetical protein